MPKNLLWDACSRAKLYAKRMKSHRVADEESDIPPPEAFAQELAIDHLIVSKTSSEKEFAVLVVREGYSGVIQAYPSAAKDSLVAQECLLKFVARQAASCATACATAQGTMWTPRVPCLLDVASQRCPKNKMNGKEFDGMPSV